MLSLSRPWFTYGERLPGTVGRRQLWGDIYILFPVDVTIPANGIVGWSYRFPGQGEYGAQIITTHFNATDPANVQVEPRSMRIGSSETIQVGQAGLPLRFIGGAVAVATGTYEPHLLPTSTIIPPGSVFSVTFRDLSGAPNRVRGYFEGRLIRYERPPFLFKTAVARGAYAPISNSVTVPAGATAAIQVATASGDSGYAVQALQLQADVDLDDIDIVDIQSVSPNGTHVLGDQVNNVNQKEALPARVYGGLVESGRRHVLPVELIIRPSQQFVMTLRNNNAGDQIVQLSLDAQWLVPATKGYPNTGGVPLPAHASNPGLAIGGNPNSTGPQASIPGTALR